MEPLSGPRLRTATPESSSGAARRRGDTARPQEPPNKWRVRGAPGPREFRGKGTGDENDDARALVRAPRPGAQAQQLPLPRHTLPTLARGVRCCYDREGLGAHETQDRKGTLSPPARSPAAPFTNQDLSLYGHSNNHQSEEQHGHHSTRLLGWLSSLLASASRPRRPDVTRRARPASLGPAQPMNATSCA
ncbi:uncharacterized protein LOC144580862 [Callithrix jacchus]